MTLPDHVAVLRSGAAEVRGAGETWFKLTNNSLSVVGAATVAALEAAIATGIFDDVAHLSVWEKCMLAGLPENTTRLSRLNSVEISASLFTDWASLYRLSTVERLVLGRAVVALSDGISGLRGLRVLNAERANKLVALPADFSALTLQEARAAPAPPPHSPTHSSTRRARCRRSWWRRALSLGWASSARRWSWARPASSVSATA